MRSFVLALAGYIGFIALVCALRGRPEPVREYCDVVSTSPDGRYRVDSYRDPLSLSLAGVAPFTRRCADEGGWFVLTDTATGTAVDDAKVESLDPAGREVGWGYRTVDITYGGEHGIDRATLELPEDVPPIAD